MGHSRYFRRSQKMNDGISLSARFESGAVVRGRCAQYGETASGMRPAKVRRRSGPATVGIFGSSGVLLVLLAGLSQAATITFVPPYPTATPLTASPATWNT